MKRTSLITSSPMLLEFNFNLSKEDYIKYADQFHDQYGDYTKSKRKKATQIAICSFLLMPLAGFTNKFLVPNETVRNILLAIIFGSFLVFLFSAVMALNLSHYKRSKKSYRKALNKRNFTTYKSTYSFYEKGFIVDDPLHKRAFLYDDLFDRYHTDHFYVFISKDKSLKEIIIPIAEMSDATNEMLQEYFGDRPLVKKK